MLFLSEIATIVVSTLFPCFLLSCSHTLVLSMTSKNVLFLLQCFLALQANIPRSVSKIKGHILPLLLFLCHVKTYFLTNSFLPLYFLLFMYYLLFILKIFILLLYFSNLISCHEICVPNF